MWSCGQLWSKIFAKASQGRPQTGRSGRESSSALANGHNETSGAGACRVIRAECGICRTCLSCPDLALRPCSRTPAPSCARSRSTRPLAHRSSGHSGTLSRRHGHNFGQNRAEGKVERLRKAPGGETRRCIGVQRQLDGAIANLEEFVSMAARNFRESLRDAAQSSQLSNCRLPRGFPCAPGAAGDAGPAWLRRCQRQAELGVSPEEKAKPGRPAARTATRPSPNRRPLDLAPAPFHENMAATPANIPVSHPTGARPWTLLPSSGHPLIRVALPTLIAGNPHIVAAGRPIPPLAVGPRRSNANHEIRGHGAGRQDTREN
jgi:hypothetical protein